LPVLALICVLAACKSSSPSITVFGLWPEQPPLRYKPYDFWSGGNYYDWPRLDADKIVLQWAAYPGQRAEGVPDTNSFFAKHQPVTYDLRIWRGMSADQFSDDLVYARDDLVNPSHEVEVPLSRGCWYFWSVRARFKLDGQTRVTEWSRIQSPMPITRQITVYTNNVYGYYRFYLY